MRSYIVAIVLGFFGVLAFQTDVRADAKAEKEAKCEQECLLTAKTNYEACHKVPQCEDYVTSELQHCMNECDK